MADEQTTEATPMDALSVAVVAAHIANGDHLNLPDIVRREWGGFIAEWLFTGPTQYVTISPTGPATYAIHGTPA